MKKFITENDRFTITVIDHAKDGKPLGCRNGHEVGDSYVCEYGCPEPTNGCGGFCSKTMNNLYLLKELVYNRADLRLRGFPNNTDIEFPCADGVVWFRIQIHDKAEILPLTADRLPEYADVLRRSFATVAQDFGWTMENALGFIAYLPDEKLAERFNDGCCSFGLIVDDKIFGFVSLTDIGNGAFELNRLAVLPQWRHYGYGKRLLDICKAKVRELGGYKITLDIIEENTILKDWYAANGFIHTGTKKFDHLPFTTGYMEWSV
jgi:uncharacterized repeat protein (TIGR04076 family)